MIGNGCIGVVVLGIVVSENLFINEDLLWLGGKMDCVNLDVKVYMLEL